MIKFLSYLSVFLGVVLFIFINLYIDRGNKIDSLETRINAYKGNVCYLEKTIEERNEKILEATEQRRKLEELAEKEKNKGGFDWNTPLPLRDSIINELRN